MMNDDPKLQQRKQNRLSDYDYSSEGLYFITICTENKKQLFGTIEEGTIFQPPKMQYSPLGKIVAEQIQTINFSDYVTVEKYVVMPNHIHLLLLVHDHDHKQRTAANEIIPHVIGTFKRFCHKKIGFQVFQRSYHDHVIRGKADFEKIWSYIDDNPRRWKEDCYNPENG